jgi:cytochrome c2
MRRLASRILFGGATLLLCASCDHGDIAKPSPSRAEMREAKHLIAANCGACHLVPGIARAKGRVGPSLAQISHQQIIAGHFANTPDELTRWIEHPQTLLPGDAMPDTGLSHDQVLKIVDYLYAVD